MHRVCTAPASQAGHLLFADRQYLDRIVSLFLSLRLFLFFSFPFHLFFFLKKKNMRFPILVKYMRIFLTFHEKLLAIVEEEFGAFGCNGWD